MSPCFWGQKLWLLLLLTGMQRQVGHGITSCLGLPHHLPKCARGGGAPSWHGDIIIKKCVRLCIVFFSPYSFHSPFSQSRVLLRVLWDSYMLYLVVVKRCKVRVWGTTSRVLEDSPSMQTYRLEIWECIWYCISPAQTPCLLIAETFVWCKMFNFIFIQPPQPDCDTVIHIVYYPRITLQSH